MGASLPLATITETLLPAVLGVIGVVVGAVTNWFVQQRTERSRLEGETRSAARLVDAEIRNALAVIEPAVGGRARLSPELGPRLATPVWDEFRGPLSLALSKEEWGAVRDALASVAALRVRVESGDGPVARDVDETARKAITELRAAEKVLEPF